MENVFLVSYYHKDCEPLKNILRLGKEDSFRAARKMAQEHEGETAFGRFADFENYYKLRLSQERYIFDEFKRLGGRPVQEHPLYFVLSGSEYLEKWFGCGKKVCIPLSDIPSHSISFTIGDSCANASRGEKYTVFTKEDIEKIISAEGNVSRFIESISKEYVYIEAQVWDDDCVNR